MSKKVLKETRRAYADCQSTTNNAYKLRNLNFRASQPVSVIDAVDIMTEALGLKSSSDTGYNEFCPDLLLYLPVGSQITLAREASVCVYVRLPNEMKNIKLTTQQNMKVDECDVQPDGTIRLWWD